MTFAERLHLVNERGLNILAIDIGNEGGMVYNWTPEKWFVIKPMSDELAKNWEVMAHSMADIIVAENVHTMPLQGVVSNGTLMKNRGRVEGMAAALKIEINWIEPLKWIECFTMKRTKHFKHKRDWKKHLSEIAKSMVDDSLVNEITLKTADAFLMWNYIASQHTDEPILPIGPKFATHG